MAFELSKISKTERSSNSNKLEALLQKDIVVFKKPFSNKTKENFYTELHILLKAGITLKVALDLIETSEKKKHNLDILKCISSDIISGKSLSEAIKQHEPFTEYEYYSIQIGEESGNLEMVIEQLGQFYGRKNEQKRQLVGALTYPLIVLSTAFLVVLFMLNFVVPMFQDIFKQQNSELPAITKFIVSISEAIKENGLIFLILFVALLIILKTLNKKVWFKRMKDKFILKTPYVGNFLKTLYLSQFTQAIKLLTASKVPLVKSIHLVNKMIHFYPLKDALETIEHQIIKGRSLSESLAEHSLFDKKMIALVKVAEETNQNEFVFERLHTQYNIKVQQSSKMLSTILEPLIIIVVGLFVGVIVVAMYLPMFKLSSIMA